VVYEAAPLVLVRKKDSGVIGSCELPSPDGIFCFEFGIHKCQLGIHKCLQNSAWCRVYSCMDCVNNKGRFIKFIS
jgi:hypothetical protein